MCVIPWEWNPCKFFPKFSLFSQTGALAKKLKIKKKKILLGDASEVQR